MIHIRLSVIGKARVIGFVFMITVVAISLGIKSQRVEVEEDATIVKYIENTITDSTTIENISIVETTTAKLYEPATQSENEETTTEVRVKSEFTTVKKKKETEKITRSSPSRGNGYYSDQDAIDIAKVLWRECRGQKSKTEQACVAWTILNRVDNRDQTIYEVIRAPYQFAFSESTRVDSELLDLAYDVLSRWKREKNGETNVGRVLPQEYMFFEGDSKHNYFRNKHKGNYDIWDYSLDSPYDT